MAESTGFIKDENKRTAKFRERLHAGTGEWRLNEANESCSKECTFNSQYMILTEINLLIIQHARYVWY